MDFMMAVKVHLNTRFTFFEQKKNLCGSIYVVSFGESTVAHPEKLQYLNINKPYFYKLEAIRWNFCLKALIRYKNLFNSILHNL